VEAFRWKPIAQEKKKRARREIRSLPSLLGALLLLPLFSRGVRRASHALITEAISDRI